MSKNSRHSLSRREFLTTTAGAGGALLLGPAWRNAAGDGVDPRAAQVMSRNIGIDMHNHVYPAGTEPHPQQGQPPRQEEQQQAPELFLAESESWQQEASRMTALDGPEQVPLAQPVLAPLTRAAIFLVVTMKPDADSYAIVRSFCGDVAGLIRAVEFRDIDAALTCIVAFGSDGWDRLFGKPRPAELHPFREFRAANRHAPATPGDLLFHIRAQRLDICFELATQIMERIGDAVSVADEVQGFRYFEDRDLIGFVDGTENPQGALALESALVGHEDAPFAGGSYVMVQKYLHDMKAWNALSTEAQELIIGRRKLTDIELEDGVKPASAHSALTVIEESGKEVKILRDNMPFGQPGRGEFGTYFIGYCRTPRITEQMLENMFIGRPPGNYDRLLDFSRAVTGGLFFAPSATFLEGGGEAQPLPAAMATPPAAADAPVASAVPDTSLGIGSLKGERNE